MSNSFTIQKYFNKNTNKKLLEWVDFKKLFKCGKQGISGILTIKNTNIDIVFKISKYINYLIQHEYTIMKSLQKITTYCPHFSPIIGTVICKVDPIYKKKTNPFEIQSKYHIEKELLLMEYIPNSSKFFSYIKNLKISNSCIFSMIKQVLLAVSIAQFKKKFTHYDLHSCNIMITNCNPDLVYLYILDKDNQVCVPTLGNVPVIIDYGFSYTEDMNNNYAWASMAHTSYGFMSNQYDKFTDPKLFLVSVSDDLKKNRNNKQTSIYRRIIKNIFYNLNIDWESGWDNIKTKNASEIISKKLAKNKITSIIFTEYDDYCIDLIQSLIILPFESHSIDDLDISYVTFVSEFMKIENIITNPHYLLYILKGMVDTARTIRSDYLSTNYRQKAVLFFKKSVYERINCVCKYGNPKSIHFEKMLCSLYCLSKNIENILYKILKERNEPKKLEYSKVPLQNIEQIYAALEVNLPTHYIFSSITTITVIDSIQEKKYNVMLTNPQLQEINKLHPLVRGSYLFSILNT